MQVCWCQWYWAVLLSVSWLQRDAVAGHAYAIRNQSRKPSKAHTHKFGVTQSRVVSTLPTVCYTGVTQLHPSAFTPIKLLVDTYSRLVDSLPQSCELRALPVAANRLISPSIDLAYPVQLRCYAAATWSRATWCMMHVHRLLNSESA